MHTQTLEVGGGGGGESPEEDRILWLVTGKGTLFHRKQAHQASGLQEKSFK